MPSFKKSRRQRAILDARSALVAAHQMATTIQAVLTPERLAALAAAVTDPDSPLAHLSTDLHTLAGHRREPPTT